MRTLKKVLIVAIAFIFLLNILTIEGTSKALTLAEILTEANGNDIDALLANREIDKLAKTKEDVYEKADETNVLAGTAQVQLRSKVTKHIDPLRADLGLEIALSNEKQRLVKREVDVTNAYWQVYLAQLAIEKAEIELEITKNNYEAAKIKLKNGSLSGYGLSVEKYTYEQKQLAFIECSNEHKKALFNLNELLGKALTSSITVDDRLTLNVPSDFSFDIDTVYHTALQVSENVYMLSKEVEFATMKLQYATEEFKQTDDEYLDAVAEKEKADYKYLNSKNNLYRSIVSEGNFLLISLDRYKLLNLKLEMEQSNMLATEIKLGNGHASTNDYLLSKANVLNAKYQLYSLITNLNYEYQNFNINYLLKTN